MTATALSREGLVIHLSNILIYISLSTETNSEVESKPMFAYGTLGISVLPCPVLFVDPRPQRAPETHEPCCPTMPAEKKIPIGGVLEA